MCPSIRISLYSNRLHPLHTYLHICRETHTKINGNNYQTLLFTDLNPTDIIIHAR